jgi:NADH-quinone oxidoreductase subunit G
MDWIIEGPRKIERHSVISQNHYEKLSKPEVQDGIE